MFKRHASAVLVAMSFYVATAFAADGETGSRNIPDKIAQSTVRLKLETPDGEYMVTGWGAAFGVDLSRLGATDPRYLLSAAHLVLKKDGKGLATGALSVEVPINGKKVWTTCKVVAVDKKNDICLLRTSVDVPVINRIAISESQSVGAQVMIVGCPSGVSPCVSIGKIVDKEPNVEGRLWEAAAKFYHGNSGGPVFDAHEGTVIGVAVAGVSNGQGDMRRDKALFLPADEIKNFLEKTVAPILRTN
jgi:S1-C subfamily serine protease